MLKIIYKIKANQYDSYTKCNNDDSKKVICTTNSNSYY